MDSKTCTKCSLALPLDAFASQGGKRKHLLRSICKKCHNIQTSAAITARRAATGLRLGSPYDYKRTALRRYKISGEEFDALFEDSACRICRREDDLHIDHDHVTGRVRGLLCGPHNRAIGLFREDPFMLREAATYIEHFNKENP